MTQDELTAKFIEMSVNFMNQNNLIDPEKCYLNPADGLWYCKKCHTAKQGLKECNGQILRHNKQCDCEYTKEQAKEKAVQEQMKNENIARLRYDAFPACKNSPDSTKNMRSWTFANDKGYQPELRYRAEKFVENFDIFYQKGKGLLFYGGVGTGKSYMAACIANALVEREKSVLMTDFATISAAVSGIYDKQGYYESLNNYSLLILDDLASERDSPYMHEIVHKVINSRCDAGLPMIITTNLTEDDIFKPNKKFLHDQRIFSRITSKCVILEVTGPDLRQETGYEEIDEMEALLGL
ncbi:MAG: ATP-binding protein [Alistipes senegalensis]|nr:ATP-binding protein [Alistipes senegalensis]